jgi:Xaa-Pro aminopeptidase
VSHEELLGRLRSSLRASGLSQAVLSAPETLAALGVFELPWEDAPVASPFVAVPALLCLGPSTTVLVVAAAHRGDVRAAAGEVVEYRAWDHLQEPDPWAELERVLARALDAAGIDDGPTGIESRHLPAAVAEWLRSWRRPPIPCDHAVAAAHRIRLPFELDAVRRACRLADVVQQAVKDRAEPGLTEVELAGHALTTMWAEVGRRVPMVLSLAAGERAAAGGGFPTGRVISAGELVLTDAAAWMGGAWSDSANSVFVGTPDPETRRRFDAVRRALHEGIELCRPGIKANELDRRIRERLEAYGPTYSHHSGHAVGVDFSVPPRITPYEELPIEEGMVIALEPAIYEAGWGGIRLESVFLVGAHENELLTLFEHTL